MARIEDLGKNNDKNTTILIMIIELYRTNLGILPPSASDVFILCNQKGGGFSIGVFETLLNTDILNSLKYRMSCFKQTFNLIEFNIHERNIRKCIVLISRID